jgi:hypothetical protein
MAKGWMMQEDATPEEAKTTWDTLEKEFEDNRKMLLASAETDAIIKTINDKFGPGTIFPASDAPQPPMTDTQRIMEWEERNKYSDGQLVTPNADGSRPGYKGRKGSAEDAINRRTKLTNDYNKIVEYALNNRKIKNFSEPVEVTIDGKLTTIDELPTVNEWADMNKVDRSTFSTKKGSLIPVKRSEVYKTIVDETIKLNNQTFTYSSPSDIAMDIGFTKNQGRGTGVEDLLKKGNVTKLLSKDEIVSKYIQHLIDKDAPLKDFTNNSIFKHINSRNADLIKISKDKTLTIPSSARTIDFNRVSKIMKANHPELFAKIGRGGQIPFLSRSIQNKSDLGNLRLSEAFQTTESGDIFFNEAKAKNIKVTKALAGITAETDILQGKLKLDQKSLAISNAQDKMVTDLNKYIRENPSVILDNPQFRNLAATRFEDGKFIIDKDPALIDDRLNRYIKRGFFSTDHKVSKRTGKLNIEFPTNKQIVPTFINGPIRSMENYIANNISKYDTDPLIKNNIDEIINVAKTNNFTVNVPKGHSNIFGTNRINVGAIQDIATVSADGKTLTSYDNQLKKFNFDIDKIPALSNVKNIDYTEVDKSRLQKTLDTKLTTAKGYKKSVNQLTDGDPKLNKFVSQNIMPSGLSGAYEMLSDDLKKIINSDGFKKFSNNPALKKTLAAGKLPTKLYGPLDLVLGYFDYQNNRQKGFSVGDSIAYAGDTMLFGITNFGKDADVAGVKKVAMEKYNMSSEVFDGLVSANKNQNEVQNIITNFAALNKQSEDLIASGMGDKSIEYGILEKKKRDSQERLKVLMAEAIKNEPSLRTNLQVQEAGAPININVDKGKAFADLSKASSDFVQKRIEDSDLENIAKQDDTTMGKIGAATKMTIGDPEWWLNLSLNQPWKKTAAMNRFEGMDQLKREDPTLYYKMLLSEGVDPNRNMNIPVRLEFEMQNPEFGTPLSSHIKSQSYFDGGIASLRRKK